MKIFKNINWRIALLIITLSSIVSPFISSLYRGYVGLTFMIVLSLIILFRGKAGNIVLKSALALNKKNRPLLIALLWFIFGIAFTFLRGANDFGYLVQVMFLPVYYFLGLFLTQNQQYQNYTSIVIVSFIFLNIIFAGGDVNATTSARDIYNDSNQSLLSGTTGFWGLVAIFTPIFLVSILHINNKLIKFIYITILFVITYKLFFSGFATPTALLLINFIIIGTLYFIQNMKKSKKIISTLFITFIFFGFAYYLTNKILNTDIPALSDVRWRFLNFIENPEGGGYSGSLVEGSRFYLMEFSWNTFLNSPILGGGGNIRTSIYEGISGGHSSAFDFLAVMGIFGGGGAFIFFVLKSFINTRRNMKKNVSFYSICQYSAIITFIIGGVMNPYWQGPILASFLLILNIYKVPNNS